jgi:flagellar P-ring protein precursor FlgI
MAYPFRGRALTRRFDKGQCSLSDVCGVLCPKMALTAGLQLGQLHRRAHLDVVEHALQARVVGADTRGAHFAGQPLNLQGRKPAFKQADSDPVERIEQPPAPRGGLAAALQRAFLTLGGQKRSQRGRRSGSSRARHRPSRRSAFRRHGETRGGRVAGATGGGGGDRAGGLDFHAPILRLTWLTKPFQTPHRAAGFADRRQSLPTPCATAFALRPEKPFENSALQTDLAWRGGPVFAWARAMVKSALLAALLGALSLGLAAPAAATSRIKDLVEVEGVRENMLVGYGLVVGLQGSGDSLRNAPFTRQSLEAMLERMGVNTRETNLNTRNVAAVMVTANLPAFAAQGSRMDISVSALGDARSLEGGTLLVTPLMGADGQVYAVAQGSLTVGGFSAGGASGSSVSRGVPTNGRIPSGAVIERELRFELARQTELRLSLRNPDFTTARRIAGAINANLGVPSASVANPSTIVLALPVGYPGDMVDLIARVESLGVEPDTAARIVVDEASGIVVMGDNVRVSTVAIAQGNLTISVQETPQVSQPNPLAQGETTVVPRSNVEVAEDRGDMTIVPGGVPLRDLVDGLNTLGVTPRDLIQILQALKAAGAIQAEIEVL